jgi:Protein of unknown function (DUF3179)
MSASLPWTTQLRHPSAPRTTPALWIAFFLCALTAIALFFVPAFIIRPFTHQSPRGLLVAMALRDRASAGTLIAGIITFAFGFLLWRYSNRWLKSLVALTLIVVTFSTVMARLNYFEWMYHPISDAQFVAQSASRLDPKEMILAVRLGDDARAYPISQMAYHHVLNDVVAGVPVAVTY